MRGCHSPLTHMLPSMRQHGESSLVAAAQAQHQVERRLLLDVVVRERAAVLQLLAREDQPLLVRRDALLVLDLGLNIVNGVRALHLESDGLTGECLDKDLHQTRPLAIRIGSEVCYNQYIYIYGYVNGRNYHAKACVPGTAWSTMWFLQLTLETWNVPWF